MSNKALLVSDSSDLIETARVACAREPFVVIGVRTADEARVVMAREAVGVVVVDEVVGGARGVDFLVELHEESPGVPRIFLASRLDTASALLLINRAAVGRIVRKPYDSSQLVAAIRDLRRSRAVSALSDQVVQLARRAAVLVAELSGRPASAVAEPARMPAAATHAFDGGTRGAMYGSRDAYSGPIGHSGRDPIANLTPIEAHKISRREKEVLRALATGKRPMEIAREFSVSVHTVRNQIKSVYGKFGIHSQGDLMAKLLNSPGRPQ